MKRISANFQATKYLFKVVKNGNLKQVKMLLDAGIALNARDSNGNSIATATLAELDKGPCDSCSDSYSILMYLMQKGAGQYMKTDELKDVYEALKKYPGRRKQCASCSSDSPSKTSSLHPGNLDNLTMNIDSSCSLTAEGELKKIPAEEDSEKLVYSCDDLFVPTKCKEHIDGENKAKPNRRNTYGLIRFSELSLS